MIARTAVVLTVVLALAGCPAPPPQGLSDEDAAAIEARLQEFAAAEEAEDWERAAGMMTEDVVVMPVDQPLVEGREGFRAWVAGFPAMDIIELDVNVRAIEGRGDLAYAWGTYAETTEMEGMEEPVATAGKFLWILEKGADGEWRVSVGMANQDAAVAH